MTYRVIEVRVFLLLTSLNILDILRDSDSIFSPSPVHISFEHKKP